MSHNISFVSRETDSKLDLFAQALGRWRSTTNLISRVNPGDLWTRHVADSAQLIALAPSGSRKWLDLGSGAGFPAVIYAIQLGLAPGIIVHCVESNQRKCAFLREAARITGTPIEVHGVRAETLSPSIIGPIDVITARGFSLLPRIVELAADWLTQGSIALLPRGETWRDQLEDLPELDHYAIDIFPSAFHPESGILRLQSRAAEGANDADQRATPNAKHIGDSHLSYG